MNTQRKPSEQFYNRNIQLYKIYAATVLPTEEEDHPYQVIFDTGERAIIVSDRTQIQAFDKVKVKVVYIGKGMRYPEVEVIE